MFTYLLLAFGADAVLAGQVDAPRPVITDERGRISALAFSGRRTLLTGSEDGEVTTWSLGSDSLTRTASKKLARRAIHQIHVSAAGKIAACSLDKLFVWDSSGDKALLELPVESQIGGFCLFPQGKKAALWCGDRKVRVVDLGTRKVLAELVTGERTHCFDEVGMPRPTRISVSADEGLIAISYSLVFLRGTHHVHVWDARSFKHLAQAVSGHTPICSGVEFHPAQPGKLAVPGLKETVDLWDIARQERTALHKFQPGGSPARNIRFSPDGKLLFFASKDGDAWLLDGGREHKLFKYDHATKILETAAFSPDGELLGILMTECPEGEPNQVSRVFLFDTVTKRSVVKSPR